MSSLSHLKMQSYRCLHRVPHTPPWCADRALHACVDMYHTRWCAPEMETPLHSPARLWCTPLMSKPRCLQRAAAASTTAHQVRATQPAVTCRTNQHMRFYYLRWGPLGQPSFLLLLVAGGWTRYTGLLGLAVSGPHTLLRWSGGVTFTSPYVPTILGLPVSIVAASRSAGYDRT